MKKREDLHQLLLQYCPNVYYQAPQNKDMKYPCIIYSRERIDTKNADNKPYTMECSYSMRYVTTDPDDPVVLQLAQLQFCKHSRHYVADNLHHDAFTIYY